MNQAYNPPDRLVRYSDLPEYGIKFSRPWLQALEARGEFPQRVKLTPDGRHVAWRESDLLEWIKARPAVAIAG